VATNELSGLNATDVGAKAPVEAGDPIKLKAPDDWTANNDAEPTLALPLLLAVASNLPSGLNATEYGMLPAAFVENGEPVTGVSFVIMYLRRKARQRG
jgi:hypothetical protein